MRPPRCPLCADPLTDPTFCPSCITRIERSRDGKVDRARRRNPRTGAMQVVFMARPNHTHRFDGPQRANTGDWSLADPAWVPGGADETATKGAAA